MFCYQCEQAANGVGCHAFGVCGKDPDVAALQDLLLHALKGLSRHARKARELGVDVSEADRFLVGALYTTVTNVNFDASRIEEWIREAVRVRDRARAAWKRAGARKGGPAERPDSPADWTPAPDREGLIRQGGGVSIESRIAAMGADRAGLQDLLLYGLKGMAAYADHARILGREDPEIPAFMHRAMASLDRPELTAEELLGEALECGRMNLRAMECLDLAHVGAFGHPEPADVRITPVAGKSILVSGHDLKDLADLLGAAEESGVNVYTHGEMLPAHGYPKLKRHPRLVGHYGGAWQDQRKEFDAFPGAILMTTNCIQKPRDGYAARLFTRGRAGWPGVAHLGDGEMAPLIEAALAAPGYPETAPERTLRVGYGHHAVLSLAPAILEAVESGAIRRFFLIGGCDGAKPGRNYYTRFAESVPRDSVILTLACGKFRFNRMEFGEIGGIPRLLDLGQCNDAHSAIRIAQALAEALEVRVNDLPLSVILSWYEQKAVCVLLSLLHLGFRNIRIGPTLPAFLSPAVLEMLSVRFGLRPIGDAEADLEAALSGK